MTQTSRRSGCESRRWGCAWRRQSVGILRSKQSVAFAGECGGGSGTMDVSVPHDTFSVPSLPPNATRASEPCVGYAAMFVWGLYVVRAVGRYARRDCKLKLVRPSACVCV